MSVPLVVPDASVILKWVLPPIDEPDAANARRLLKAIVADDVRAVLPSLWLHECGNTIARRFPDEADEWLHALMKLGIDEYPTSPAWLDQALDLTRRHAVTFYDAAYHAVAMVEGGVFVTADGRYLNRAAGAGSMMALEAWRAPGGDPAVTP